MQLVRPSIVYKDSFLKADADVFAMDGKHLFRYLPLNPDKFEYYCNSLISYESEGVPDDKVNASIFWLVDNNRFIGRIIIRHELTEDMLLYHGNIGYIIAPEFRKQGYGTAILKLGLEEAGKLGLKKVLVTCDKTNTASAKIIEKNGGVFEDEAYEEGKAIWKKRYWINTAGID
jgi:predicted acetyltransferase